jgi:hypothetical protein
VSADDFRSFVLLELASAIVPTDDASLRVERKDRVTAGGID